MGRHQRNKGARGEREIVAAFASRGVELHRTPNSGAFKWHESMPGDVQGLDGFHIEVKRAESLRINQWIEQTEEDCPDQRVPLLLFRRSNHPWRAVIRLEHLMDMMDLAERDEASHD